MARSHTRTLTKATPTVRTADDAVINWKFTVDFVDSLNGWSRTYDFDVDLPESSIKTPSDFSKADILALIPETYDHIYEAHWQSQNPDPNPAPAVEAVVSDFDLSDLKTVVSK
jgi:hypothetical protein